MSFCLNCSAPLVVAVILVDRQGEYALCRRCFSSKPTEIASAKTKAKNNARKTPHQKPGSHDQVFQLRSDLHDRTDHGPRDPSRREG